MNSSKVNRYKLKRSRGFTLVELLISMTILSMIMLLGSWSFSLFTSKWEGRLGHFSQSVSQAKDLILLSDIVSSIIPYVYLSSNKPVYYFSATPTELYGVTQSAIFHPESPVAFKMTVETNDDASKYLLYQEAKLGVISSKQGINYTHEKVLVEQAEDIHFAIYGWESVDKKMASEDPLSAQGLKPLWREQYDSSESSLMPISVAIYWNGSEILIPVINDHGSWLSRLAQGDE